MQLEPCTCRPRHARIGAAACVLGAFGIILGGCVLRPAAARPEQAPSLRVATYNLNYGLAGDPVTAEAVAATGAEVVLLQEVSAAWARELRALARDRFPHACFAASRWPAGGAAILSRHPLRDCDRSESPLGWFPALAATVDSPIGRVRVVNVHLQPARAGAQVFADLAALPRRHRREIATHLARLTGGELPTILAGDFNEGDTEGALAELASLGYRSALAEHAPAATTWRWQIGAMPIEKRLDHILYQRGSLHCASAAVLREGRSDHYPVVARLTLPVPAARLMGSSLLEGRSSALTPTR